MKRFVFVTALVLVLAAQTGLASADSSVADKYVTALNSDVEGKTQGQALKYAAAGSLASEYAKYADANGAAFKSVLSGGKKQKIKGGFRLCDAQKRNCADYTSFRTQKGKVVSFNVHGDPLDKIFKPQNQSATDGPLTFTTRWAYVTSAGTLRVVLDVRNDGDRALLPTASSTVWIDANGRQQSNNIAVIAEASPEVNAHATGTMIVDYPDPDGQIGGRLHVEAYDNNPPPNEPQAHYRVDIPIG